MAEPVASPAQKRMDAIRNRASIASTDWSVLADGEMCLTTGAGGEMAIVARIPDEAPIDDRDFLLHLPEDHIWLLGMYDKLVDRHRNALDEIKRLSPPPSKPKDFAAECAMKCGNDHLFRRFLQECHDLVDASDAERVKTRVRSLLAIQSMAELNTDENARERWKSLRAEFDNWRRGNEPARR